MESNLRLEKTDSEIEECRSFTIPEQSIVSQFQSSKLDLESISSPLSEQLILIPYEAVPLNMEKLQHKSSSVISLNNIKILSGQNGKLQTHLKSLPNVVQTVDKSCTASSSNKSSIGPVVKTLTKFNDDPNTIIAQSIPNSFNKISKYRTIVPRTYTSSTVSDNDSNKQISKKSIVSSIAGNVNKSKTQTKPIISIVGGLSTQKNIFIPDTNNQMNKVLIPKKIDNNYLLNKICLKKIDGSNKVIILKNESSSKSTVKNLEVHKLGNYSSRELKRAADSNLHFEKSNKKLCPDLDRNFTNSSDKYPDILNLDEDGDNSHIHVEYKKFQPKGNVVIKKIFKKTSNVKKLIDFSCNEFILSNVDDSFNKHDVNNVQLMNNSKSSLIEPSVSHESNEIDNELPEINVLEKAVLSIEDKKLRTEALKALSECGVKVKKSIPLMHSRPHKLINESSTQTDVFFLLEKGQFTNIDEKQNRLLKMSSKSKINTQTLNNFNSKASINNEWSDEYKFQLDKMLNNFDNKNTLEIKNVLEGKHSDNVSKILLKELNIVFENAKSYDDDGFLAIHRAVLNSNIQQVQKNLIILNACKLSVDIESQNFKTSLELAIEFEVNPQIVKILLNAGAKPVSSKLRHDSALILAARTSSKMISLLIRSINESNYSLMNAKDSDGLAPIHYCAQYGNLEGITELIKLGADVNLQDDKSGRTALFYAIECRDPNVSQEVYEEIAHKLIKKGAFSDIPIFSKHNLLLMMDKIKSHSLKIALNTAVR